MSRSALCWAVAAWMVVFAVVSIRIALKPRSQTVVPIFVTAGQNWRDGHELYGLHTTDLDQFRYTPAVAAMFVPWTTIPTFFGEATWRALNVVVFAAALTAWWRWSNGNVERLPVALLLCLPLAIGGLNNGQCNLLVAGLLLVAGVTFAREKWHLAAAAVTAATLFKGYPLALGLLLALLEPRRFAPRLAILLVAGLALPFAVQMPDYVISQYAAFFDHLGTDDRSGFPLGTGYRDFQMLLAAWGMPLALPTYRLLEVAAGVACAVIVLAVRRRSGRQHAVRASVSLSLCWMTLFGPATESVTYVLVAPVLAQAVIDAASQSAGRRWLAYGSFAAFALSMASVWLPREANLAVQSSGLQPAAAALLTVAVVIEALIPRREDFISIVPLALPRAA